MDECTTHIHSGTVSTHWLTKLMNDWTTFIERLTNCTNSQPPHCTVESRADRMQLTTRASSWRPRRPNRLCFSSAPLSSWQKEIAARREDQWRIVLRAGLVATAASTSTVANSPDTAKFQQGCWRRRQSQRQSCSCGELSSEANHWRDQRDHRLREAEWEKSPKAAPIYFKLPLRRACSQWSATPDSSSCESFVGFHAKISFQ